MIRSIHGLLWQVDSPSSYRLLSVNDDIGEGGSVHVVYAGRRSYSEGWWIMYCQPGRLPIWREFVTRDAAMALIASRRGAA